jgi:hypothetical protein
MRTQLLVINGNNFPDFNGEALSWSIGLYDTINESHQNYPRMRAVIRAFRDYRPLELEKERRLLLRASFDQVFGNAAKQQLALINEEVSHSV